MISTEYKPMRANDPIIFVEKPGVSPSNRSLLRGIEILRAFRPGSDLLGNSEIAERTGLARATVSRLTQTLVAAGMLQLDYQRRAYRLAPATLGLGHAMRTGSKVLSIAAPKMRIFAESHGMNVGLAAADRDEMIYLESIRYKRRVAFRNVMSGQRIPMELTSLGRAYLSTISMEQRKALFTIFRLRRQHLWQSSLRREIESAIQEVQTQGYCAASWQPGAIAVATPLHINGTTYVLNTSLSTHEPFAEVVPRLAKPLLILRDEVSDAMEKQVFC